jgi:hypothetical protein
LWNAGARGFFVIALVIKATASLGLTGEHAGVKLRCLLELTTFVQRRSLLHQVCNGIHHHLVGN